MPSNITRNSGEPGHFVAELEDTPIAPIDSAINEAQKPRSTWSDAWDSMRHRPLFWISSALIALIVVVALAPNLFTQVSPIACDLAFSNQGPSAGHPFGYTRQGCDTFSRVIHGTQASLLVGVLATVLAALLGIVFGAVAGYYGGLFDSALSRVADIFFAIPTVLGGIVVMSVFSEYRTPLLVAFVLAVFAWPQIARIMRGAVLTAKQSDYVMASRALGVSKFRVLLRHVMPNAIAPVIVVATIMLGTFIVAEATLSFLGIGLPPDVMSWGNDIGQARTTIRTSPMTLFWPAAALSITVLSFLMLGDVVSDALDPKARARR
ncbi:MULTISPECIES: ABC transporter permease [unclassified Salinibacterium]|uniref:ABC transporter permease n=1 Tax=unclassified Salinibacterium TaxID=2632331 RepID=UPI0014216FD7|nr:MULTISPECIES: ABC transporter permease [unclassified Salinibacterium]